MLRRRLRRSAEHAFETSAPLGIMNDSPATPEPCPLYRQATCHGTRAILTARTGARPGGKADASEGVPTGANGGITDVSRRIRSSPCADRPVPASRDPIVRISTALLA